MATPPKGKKTPSPTVSPTQKVGKKDTKTSKKESEMPSFEPSIELNVVSTEITSDGGTLSISNCVLDETTSSTETTDERLNYNFDVCFTTPTTTDGTTTTDYNVDAQEEFKSTLLQDLENAMVDNFLPSGTTCETAAPAVESIGDTCPAVSALYFPSTHSALECDPTENQNTQDDCYNCNTYFQLACHVSERRGRGRQFRLLSKEQKQTQTQQTQEQNQRNTQATTSNQEIQQAFATFLKNYFEKAFSQQGQQGENDSTISNLEFNGFTGIEQVTVTTAPTPSPVQYKSSTDSAQLGPALTNDDSGGGGGGAVGIFLVLAALLAVGLFVVKRGRDNAQKIENRNAQMSEKQGETDSDGEFSDDDHDAKKKHEHEHERQPSVVATLVEPVPEQDEAHENDPLYKGTVVTALVEPSHNHQDEEQQQYSKKDDTATGQQQTTSSTYAEWMPRIPSGFGADNMMACGMVENVQSQDHLSDDDSFTREMMAQHHRQPPQSSATQQQTNNNSGLWY